MRIVQIFNREDREMEKFEKINAAHRDANIHSIWYYSVFFPVVEALSAASIGMIVWYGGGEAIRGMASFGVLVAFIQYINQLFRPIRELADKFNTLQMGMVSSERIFRLMDEQHADVNNGRYKSTDIKGKIEFKNVWFAYKNDEWVLRDLSFTIEAGESVAIVGATGAGKTTIISLVNRLYEIQKGQILIDDVDICEYELSDLRSRIGIVLQDVFLFSDSIINNISLYDESISEQDVKKILDQTGATAFIQHLPGTYHYNPGERGGMLSTGQRQLISFARVLVHKPRIIILDEATSSVDADLEKLIVQATELATEGRTSIIIAHRLATVKKAKRIFVMEKGRIIEQGSHEQLLKLNGTYNHLYHVQFNMPDGILNKI
jgi:ATP-binding cassette subfamily B protein